MVLPLDFIEIVIPAKPDFIGVIRLTASGIANQMGYSIEDIEDIKIAVTEACVNLVNHGYGNVSGTVQVKFGVHEDKLDILVLDKGKSYDINQIVGNLGVIRDGFVMGMPDEGLGLYLIDALMDHVEINSEQGIAVTMTKFLHKSGVEHNGKIKEPS